MGKQRLLSSNEVFNDIYEKLVVYHQHNKVYIIDRKFIKSTNLKKLKAKLISEGIEFEVTETQLICKLSEREKAVAEKVYTPEAIKKLENEQRVLDFKFWNEFWNL